MTRGGRLARVFDALGPRGTYLSLECSNVGQDELDAVRMELVEPVLTCIHDALTLPTKIHLQEGEEARTMSNHSLADNEPASTHRRRTSAVLAHSGASR